ncbi:MAG TPA: YbhB/YbcL family Raf kinase inhibitor-like protein [Chthoniobacterales bacterium]|jgi:Raf kinase inhibitor-like YbhB/YbcL family protein|nr:YbhB/YbcL family Raf kinase inhibitor-like protein [Chthoniobacterales bacterium]
MKSLIAVGCTFAAAAVVALAAGGGKIKISSPTFAAGAAIPAEFTCDGANVSPPLLIEGAPVEAKSLALIVDDPDAPSGLFTHWIIWNMDPKTRISMPEAHVENGIEGKNDFGKVGYGGPCPPSGTHRYFFKVFALDRMLDLKPGAKRQEVDAAMKGHVIGQGQLMGKYSKK